jgi:EAL domain-containing protein (putative c-di-GMP-specific phosphodiesterase class I)
MPSEFVPVAEESDLIVPVGEWTLHAACRQGRIWAGAAGSNGVGVSVNLSGRQVAAPDLIRHVQAALDASGLAPDRLTLEITESVVMSDVDRAVEVLSRLRDFGVRLSIDDFGTGYSSLSYLKRFPVDALKIDRSFVAGLGDDPDDAVIIGAIVRLGAALGIETVAEGVETARQVEELIRLGCNQAQGFFFSAPNLAEVISARYGLAT